MPDLGELKNLVSAKTKLISLTNPNNPTGSLISEEMLYKIADIARTCDAYLLCDEVYRGCDQEGNGFSKSIADIYEKGISTASMSKSFSLAGLRLGWMAGPIEILKAVSIRRDYNTISISMIDDHFAAIALESKDKIIDRNQKITRGNLKILDEWIQNEPLISYVKPKSGTTALLKYDIDIHSRDFCVNLLDKTGVMLTPGSAMDMEGYLRIGYANNVDILKTGLNKISEFLSEYS
ncbi:MAG: aminotransferase class I/II-fold pyridoxal phosphate-dependent enzyme [Emcibacteraceae bacterium]|nr:aminotransferase class I/II-fold pyridoxal phosphate-dependent enzyme [Emcibacteraceae bacterium]